MRIGVNCFFLDGDIGGIQQYFGRLMRRLLAEPDDEYVLFHLPANVSQLDETLRCEWRRHAVMLRSWREIERFLPQLDVYFCPAGRLSPRPVSVASVVTLVDVQEAYFPQFFPWRDRWFRLYHYPASTRLANRVITISEFSRHSIAAFHRIAVSKIDVAHLAPDDGLCLATAADPHLLPSGLPERFLLYPANLWQHKNHERLLQALALARDAHSVCMPCVLTGSEVPHGPDLAAALARHRLDGQVRFIGYQSSATLAALYRRATALVFPSLFEGFGLPVVEAMAAGCPVACSNTTSLPEVAGDAAAYFNPEDPADIATTLVALWGSEERRARLVRAGHLRVQRFSLAAMVAVHRQAFAAAVEDFRRRGQQSYPRFLLWRDLMVSAWQSARRAPRTGLIRSV